VLVAGAALFPAGCGTTASRPQIAEQLDALFADLHARGLFEGAVVVSGRGGVLFEKGYGYADAARQVPFTPDTPADGASLAKTFTAALLLALHDEGVLQLDDRAQKYLPELPYAEVTLRHLVSHSSGLAFDYDYFDAHLPRDQVRTTEMLLDVVAAQKPPLASTPGTAFEYSSFGYDLAALAAARALRTTYGALLAERYFRPLGLTSAFLRPGRLSEFPGTRTLGYRGTGAQRELHDVFDLEAFHGGSNIYFSARDLDRWNRSFFSAKGVQRPATIGNSPSGLTLGSWYRDGDSRFWYSGHLQAFHNEVFRDTATQESIVYVSNNTMEPWLQKAIVRAVRAVLRGEEVRSLVAPAVVAVTKDERAALAGRWLLRDGEEVVITAAAENRFSVTRDGVAYRIVPIGPSMFYVPGLDWLLGTSGPPADPRSRLYVATNVDERWGARKPAT
jgi:CubicO group peptidase (beta-lactamase class C family)